MEISPESQSLAVLGLGYVGCVTAACFAQLGHRVYGVDKDETKVAAVRKARAPFYEPGLEAIVREGVATGLLCAGTDAEAALAAADVVFICVGTPSLANGNLSTEHLERVFTDIERHLAGRTRPLIVAMRSTVFPGTTEELAAPLARYPNASVVCNPEFLREGAAVSDFRDPSLAVVGGDDVDAVRRVASLYAPLGVNPCLVSLRAAEMIKYSCNAFHALKIAFANETGALASQLGVAPDEVMATLCRDTRLNISPAYLKPAFAFGGSCLPKDLRALTYRALRMDLKLPLLESILPSNERHLERAVRTVLDLPASRVGVFGLAFKENTDDLRESAVVAAIEQWIGKGKEIRVYDSHIRLDSIYGSNRNFVLKVLPHIGRLMVPSLDELFEWCECVVVAQKPDRESRVRIAGSQRPVIDLIGMSDKESA